MMCSMMICSVKSQCLQTSGLCLTFKILTFEWYLLRQNAPIDYTKTFFITMHKKLIQVKKIITIQRFREKLISENFV